MKVLTVRQPWAWAIIFGGKDVENRGWKTNVLDVGDRFAIHAAQKLDSDLRLITQSHNPRHRIAWPPDYVLGSIIGTVQLIGFSDEAHNYSTWAARGSKHWVLADPRPLAEPIPCKGRLGLWEYDLDAALSPKEPTDA